MMMRSAGALMLLACLAAAAHAHDKPNDAKPVTEAAACKPECTSARQDCRAQVQQATEGDTRPVLSMNQNTNPYAAATREVRPQSQQLLPTEAQAFRARRAERLQACEVQYRRCTRACG
jgi:hypothetical protein